MKQLIKMVVWEGMSYCMESLKHSVLKGETLTIQHIMT